MSIIKQTHTHTHKSCLIQLLAAKSKTISHVTLLQALETRTTLLPLTLTLFPPLSICSAAVSYFLSALTKLASPKPTCKVDGFTRPLRGPCPPESLLCAMHRGCHHGSRVRGKLLALWREQRAGLKCVNVDLPSLITKQSGLTGIHLPQGRMAG